MYLFICMYLNTINFISFDIGNAGACDNDDECSNYRDSCHPTYDVVAVLFVTAVTERMLSFQAFVFDCSTCS